MGHYGISGNRSLVDLAMILAELKAATAEIHARTERLLPSLAALATRAGYVRCLVLLHEFHAGWEPAIWSTAGVKESGFDRRTRAKLPLIAHDLECLDVVHGDRLSAVPQPILADCATALGALYVLEGATLGGQVIERHAARDVGITPDEGGSYFHGYGARTGDMWRAFGDTLSAWVDRNGQAPSIVQGSVDCFLALESWAGQSALEAVAHD